MNELFIIKMRYEQGQNIWRRKSVGLLLEELKRLYASITELEQAIKGLFENTGDESYQHFYTRAYRTAKSVGLIQDTNNSESEKS